MGPLALDNRRLISPFHFMLLKEVVRSSVCGQRGQVANSEESTARRNSKSYNGLWILANSRDPSQPNRVIHREHEPITKS